MEPSKYVICEDVISIYKKKVIIIVTCLATVLLPYNI